MSTIMPDERRLGALWGALVGDALGVPVEFQSREQVQRNPVREMRGYGTHRQPPGTWSDDSSLLVCTVESFSECGGYEPAHLAAKFVRWKREAHWTPHGTVFDIGIATAQAIGRLAHGTPPEQAGGEDEYSNGNGSLMRILPVALWFFQLPAAGLVRIVHGVSALTHRHQRSQMACALYCFLVGELLHGTPKERAWPAALATFAECYGSTAFAAERRHFHLLERADLASLAEREIRSGGYVLETLTASVWCLLTTDSFREAVLKAVNLGSDTDTTGTVTGGLAGAYYGLRDIPPEWISALARRAELDALFARFLAPQRQLAPASA